MDYPVFAKAPDTADAMVPHALDGDGKAVPVTAGNPLPVGGEALQALVDAAGSTDPVEIVPASVTAFGTITPVPVGTAATLILAANPDAVKRLVKSPAGGADIFIGNAGVTTATGYLLQGGETLDLSAMKGALYGIKASGSQIVYPLEL